MSASSGRALFVAGALFVAVFVGTHVASFPGTLAHFRAAAPGQRIFDLDPASSPDEVHARLDAMGPAGRAAHRRLVSLVDVVFPLAAGGFLLVLAAYAKRGTQVAALAAPLAALVLARARRGFDNRKQSER